MWRLWGVIVRNNAVENVINWGIDIFIDVCIRICIIINHGFRINIAEGIFNWVIDIFIKVSHLIFMQLRYMVIQSFIIISQDFIKLNSIRRCDAFNKLDTL